MSTFIQTEISADQIADAMNEDANFAWDMWITLADRCDMGVMADNFVDLASGNKSEARAVIGVMRRVFDTTEQLYLSAE